MEIRKKIMIEQHLYNGDSADVLKELKDNSVDMLATDPPYGIEFMGKSWDKVLPPTDIWEECYRVLKPGSFIAVMSSPRSDVLYRMINDLEDAGFDMSFSPIMWTYHSGFPKASDTSKMLDKRLGGVVKEGKGFTSAGDDGRPGGLSQPTPIGEERDAMRHTPDTDLAKKYEGSKLGFQPKPAVEHIIIGMKPHGSKSYIDNVLNFEALPDNIKMTYPFIQVPKPAKKEKMLGTDKTIHPTIKPVKLMSYIITLFTREGDWVMDPFLGSGTSGLASKLLNRNFIGVEREKEYFDICEERLSVSREELVKFFKMEKDTQTKLDL
jgi:site-specific DNA-methyltransferase (adenine-specific)